MSQESVKYELLANTEISDIDSVFTPWRVFHLTCKNEFENLYNILK